MPESPYFTHRFRTDKQAYVLDVNTSRIFQINDCMWDLLEDETLFSDQWSLKQCGANFSHYNQQELLDAREALMRLKRDVGAFSTWRPDKLPGLDQISHDKKAYDALGILTLEVTEACNLRCKYCIYSDYYPETRGFTTNRMTFETAKKAIDFFLLKESKEFSSIGFYGGEPLVNFPLIRKVLAYLEKYPSENRIFNMTINGTLLSEEVIQFLVKYDFNLMISLDGPAQCHDANRREMNGRPTWHKVTEALEAIKELDEAYYYSKIRIASVLSNATDIEQYYEYFSDFELTNNSTRLSCSLVGSQNTDYWKQNKPSEEWLGSLTNLKYRYYNDLVDGNEQNPVLNALYRDKFIRIYKRDIFDKPNTNPVWLNGCCIPGVRRLFVDTRGEFYACERVERKYPLGNVDDGFKFPVIDEMLQKYIEEREDDCKNCWLVRSFCSDCFATSNLTGDIDSPERKMSCENKRKEFSQALIDYCTIAELNPHAFDFMDSITIS